jgi:hypothetical protein
LFRSGQYRLLIPLYAKQNAHAGIIVTVMSVSFSAVELFALDHLHAGIGFPEAAFLFRQLLPGLFAQLGFGDKGFHFSRFLSLRAGPGEAPRFTVIAGAACKTSREEQSVQYRASCLVELAKDEAASPSDSDQNDGETPSAGQMGDE